MPLLPKASVGSIKMASIVGTAGMGKTTLARLVYEAIENKFEARAFVSVNPGGDMKEVLKSILQQVGAVLPSGATGEKRLINTISKFLKEKRCANLYLELELFLYVCCVRFKSRANKNELQTPSTLTEEQVFLFLVASLTF